MIETFCAAEYYDPITLGDGVVMINIQEFFNYKTGKISSAINVLDYNISEEEVNYGVKLESIGYSNFDPSKREIAYELITKKHSFKSISIFNTMIEKTGLDIGYLPTI